MYADFKTEWKGAGMADITDRLIVKKENGVGRIMLDNQARRNAMTFEMWQSLPSALDDFMADDNVRVIVVSGKGGKAFCAGADISQFEKNRSSEEATAMYNEAVSKASTGLAETAKPTIAKINGYCYGGGIAFTGPV